MGAPRTIRAELERSAEEATYLAVGLGILAVRELRRRRAAGPPPAPERPADRASTVARDLRTVLDGLGRLARDLQQGWNRPA